MIAVVAQQASRQVIIGIVLLAIQTHITPITMHILHTLIPCPQFSPLQQSYKKFPSHNNFIAAQIMLKFMSHQPRRYVNSILFVRHSIDTRHSQIYSSILEDTHIYIPHTSLISAFLICLLSGIILIILTIKLPSQMKYYLRIFSMIQQCLHVTIPFTMQ